MTSPCGLWRKGFQTDWTRQTNNLARRRGGVMGGGDHVTFPWGIRKYQITWRHRQGFNINTKSTKEVYHTVPHSIHTVPHSTTQYHTHSTTQYHTGKCLQWFYATIWHVWLNKICSTKRKPAYFKFFSLLYAEQLKPFIMKQSLYDQTCSSRLLSTVSFIIKCPQIK